MKSLAFAGMVAALCSLSCDSPGGGSPGRGRDQRFFCRQFTTCGACTPVLGCGWCQDGDKGLCADDPNECAGAASFSWTWESSGCPGITDGGADTREAGRDARPKDAEPDAPVEHATSQ